jgi:hypothetical protein
LLEVFAEEDSTGMVMDVVDTAAVDVVVVLAIGVGAVVAMLLATVVCEAMLLVVGVGAYVGLLLAIDATNVGLLVSTDGSEVVVGAGLSSGDCVETAVAVPVRSAIVPGSQALGPENQPVKRLAMSVA